MRHEPLVGGIEHDQELFTFTLANQLFGSFLLYLYVNIILLGELLCCLWIAYALYLVYEPYYIAVLAAAEAFEDAFRRRDRHRGRALIMKWAAAEIVGTALA